MDACARPDDRGGWKTLEVQGEGFERRLEFGLYGEGERMVGVTEIPQTGVSSRLGLEKRR